MLTETSSARFLARPVAPRWLPWATTGLYALFETWLMIISQARATAIKAMGGVVMRKLFFPTICTTARSGVVATAVLWTACRYVAYQKDWLHAALIFIFMAIGYTMYAAQSAEGKDWDLHQVWIWHGSVGAICWLHVGAVHYAKYVMV